MESKIQKDLVNIHTPESLGRAIIEKALRVALKSAKEGKFNGSNGLKFQVFITETNDEITHHDFDPLATHKGNCWKIRDRFTDFQVSIECTN